MLFFKTKKSLDENSSLRMQGACMRVSSGRRQTGGNESRQVEMRAGWGGRQEMGSGRGARPAEEFSFPVFSPNNTTQHIPSHHTTAHRNIACTTTEHTTTMHGIQHSTTSKHSSTPRVRVQIVTLSLSLSFSVSITFVSP